MAVVTVKPDGDGTTTEWTPKGAGDNYVEVDEGISGADDDETEVTSDPDDIDFYTLDAMPGDFDVCVDRTITVRAYQSGRVDDNMRLRPGIFQSNETSIVGPVEIVDISAITSYTDDTGSTVANTDSKALWDTYKFRVRSEQNASGMPDAITVFVTAVEVVINYTSTGGAVVSAVRPLMIQQAVQRSAVR